MLLWALALLGVANASLPATCANLQMSKLKLPKHFSIAAVACNVTDARQIAQAADGSLYVGSRIAGSVYHLRDTNADGFYETRDVLASGLSKPSGVALDSTGALYVTETRNILKFPSPATSSNYTVLYANAFPANPTSGFYLNWHYLKISPHDSPPMLYASVGAGCRTDCVGSPHGPNTTCDPCDASTMIDNRFSTIMRFALDGSSSEIFAKGIRFSVGFDWHPDTIGNKHDLWFTENAHDADPIQASNPPDELNFRAGDYPVGELPDFGYPACHGANVYDLSYSNGTDCSTCCNGKIPMEFQIGEHVAPLGMTFYPYADTFPPDSRNPQQDVATALIALHGAFGNDPPGGHSVIAVKIEGRDALSSYVLVDGFMDSSTSTVAWGRPADVYVSKLDKSVLVSDDAAGAVYRIIYTPPDDTSAAAVASPLAACIGAALLLLLAVL
eukprot:TRINITY_DN2781_c0_g1_i1.p1 TRINITY_DN2781_c0_g1~~TRINITY_DN2781_c0_g1_i1.p1  ORF type:complete len:452 (-),score=76.28 TRINITY_DN2781_c0_g1_i1:48-1379(-)